MPLSLLGYSLHQLGWPVDAVRVVTYFGLVALGIAFFYSLMIMLAATSVWLGRNQGLYEFWFYITVFARYPRNIYGGSPAGMVLQMVFSYVVPILLVITVPAEVIVNKVLEPSWIMLVTAAAAIGGLFVSRRVFYFALKSYRSASS